MNYQDKHESGQEKGGVEGNAIWERKMGGKSGVDGGFPRRGGTFYVGGQLLINCANLLKFHGLGLARRRRRRTQPKNAKLPSNCPQIAVKLPSSCHKTRDVRLMGQG